ncbi:MAG: class I SAM-dependent methyltransferase [Thermoanaerobaculia bacterium]
MKALDRRIRKIVPSTAVLSRSKAFHALSLLSDAILRPLWRLSTRQPLPPVRLLVRTGVGNSLLFPHYYYLTASSAIWLHFFSQGYANLESDVVDIGCGVGKSAVALRDFQYMGTRFEGSYHGFDVDPEMVAWCRAHFPPDRFRFTRVDARSTVYNPGGTVEAQRLDRPDASADLVFSQSLFSHLLENDIRQTLAESRRILRPGGVMLMTFFCMDDLRALDLLGGRWSFSHGIGPAFVENRSYPESAVAYARDWMLAAANAAGFREARVILPSYQSTLECRP